MTTYDHPDAPPRDLTADEVIDHYTQQIPGLWQHLQNVTRQEALQAGQQEGRRAGRAAELARLFARRLGRPLREEEQARIALALTTQQEEAAEAALLESAEAAAAWLATAPAEAPQAPG